MRLVGHRIVRSFGDRKVLDSANIYVEQGEAVAVMGPSGSGKTTLLSVLGGILPPDKGEVYVEEHGSRSRQIAVAWVLQTALALGRRTTLDNVLVATRSNMRDSRSRRESADKALARVGLIDRAMEQARRLSGGELQRLAIARALVADAHFILGDEPTGQLDAATTTTVMDALFCGRLETGLLIATHDRTVADRCDRVLSIVGGRIQEE